MLWKLRGCISIGLRSVLLVAGLLLGSGTVFGQDFTDASGEVTIRIYYGSWVYGQHNTASVSVDSDFVLVGGGAEISGQGNPGALLTGSYPDSGLTTWYASSKDHSAAYSHYLRAWAIGLRLNGVSATDLRNNMVLVSQYSSQSQRPTAAATLPSGYLLVGGGTRVNWSGAGLLLTESYPNGTQWVGAAKDHSSYAIGSVTTYAIGITDGSIPGFGSLSATVNTAYTYAATGYGSAFAASPSGWVSSSIGGLAYYSGAGRMLTHLIPGTYTLGGLATSKDHSSASGGTTLAYVVSIQKQ